MTTVSDKIETMNPSFQPFTVLAVDDSAICRKLVEQSLLGQQYEVLFAKNGREALDLFAEHQPAVVITDWSMPDISGLEPMQAYSPRLPRLPLSSHPAYRQQR
jgi:CheY-like chemotaxis protein